MQKFGILLLVLGIFIIMNRPVLAQNAPELHSYNQHFFMSVPVRSGSYRRLFYQSCNRSESESAFYWEGAGFGVTALAQLKPDFCVYKNRYTKDQIKALPKAVKFQGGRSESVLTLVTIASEQNPIFPQVRSSIEAFVGQPGGVLSLTTMRFAVSESGDKGAVISLSGSGEFDDLVFVLPESSLKPEELREQLTPKSDPKEIEVGTFGEFTNGNDGNVENVMFSGISNEMIAIRLFDAEGASINADLILENMRLIGNQAVLFSRIGSQVVVRNDVNLLDRQ